MECMMRAGDDQQLGILDSLSREDTRIRTASTLLSRLEVSCADDEASGVLRLIGRFVGYHPAILEQVLAVLTVAESPEPIIEVLPLLMVGASRSEVERTVETLMAAMNEDLGGLLIPVLGALFELPLTPKLRKMALRLAKDALSVVGDADVPAVVRTLLRTLDEQTDASVLTVLRQECSSLSPNSTAILVDVLSSALSTSPYAARLLLLSIRAVPSPLNFTLMDTLVLVLLFPTTLHQAAAKDLMLRLLTSPGGACRAFSLLSQLVSYTSMELWASLTSPLLEMAQWLLVCSSSASSKPRHRLALTLLQQQQEPTLASSSRAAQLLKRMFELHAHLRDRILSFLTMLCVPTAVLLPGSSSLSSGGTSTSIAALTCAREAEDSHLDRLRELLPFMSAASNAIASIANDAPQLLMPYAGVFCDQLLNSAANLPTPVMLPLLGALACLARSQPSSGIESTLIIYVQKQLWAASAPGDDTAVDDRRKLSSLVLAEALVLGPQSSDMASAETTTGRDRRHHDLDAILTWIVRTTPLSSPKVAAQGLQLLTRAVISLRADKRDIVRGDDGAQRVMAAKLWEALRALLGRIPLLVPRSELIENDCAQYSYCRDGRALSEAAQTFTTTRAGQARDAGKKRARDKDSNTHELLTLLVQSEPTRDSTEASEPNAVWAIQHCVDGLMPALVSAEGDCGVGMMRLIRTMLTAVLEVDFGYGDGDIRDRKRLDLLVRLASAPLLLPPWPGPCCDTLDDYDLRSGWEVDSSLWHEVVLEKTEPSRGGRGKKGKAPEADESCHEDEWDENPFRERVSSKDKILRAGWCALYGAVVTSAVLEAGVMLKTALPAEEQGFLMKLTRALFRRLADLTERVRRCLEWTRPRQTSQRTDGLLSSEPLKTVRSRRRLECALGALAAGLSPLFLDALVEHGTRVLTATEGEDEAPGLVSWTDDQLRDVKAVGLLMQLRLDEAQASSAFGDDTEQGLNPSHLGGIISQLPQLNDLLANLRPQRRVRVSGPQVLEPGDVSRMLCLYLRHAQMFFRRAAEAEASSVMGLDDDVARVDRAGPSTGVKASRRTSPRVGVTTLAELCMSRLSEQVVISSSRHQDDATEQLYKLLVEEADRADDEAVMCGLMELLVCLTLGTSKATEAVCWDVYRWLDTPYSVVEPLKSCLPVCPSALDALLRSAVGSHELQTRTLTDLYKCVVSTAAPYAQHPVLRQMVLTFWALLPRHLRAVAVLRLLEAVQASLTISQDDGGPRSRGHAAKSARQKKAKRRRSSSDGGGDGRAGRQHSFDDARPLRSIDVEAAPAMLELLLLLAIATLVLARPRRPRAGQEIPSVLSGPFIEIQMALVALAHALHMVGPEGVLSCLPSAQGRRLLSVTLKTCLKGLIILRWHLDGCMSWRSGVGDENDAEGGTSTDELAVSTTADMDGLFKAAADFGSVVLSIVDGVKGQIRKGPGSCKKSYAGTDACKRVPCVWSGAQSSSVPRCILELENLLDFLRQSRSVLRLPLSARERGVKQLRGDMPVASLLRRGVARAMLDQLESRDADASGTPPDGSEGDYMPMHEVQSSGDGSNEGGDSEDDSDREGFYAITADTGDDGQLGIEWAGRQEEESGCESGVETTEIVIGGGGWVSRRRSGRGTLVVDLGKRTRP